MNVLPVSYKDPLNRIKGNRNVVIIFFFWVERNALLAYSRSNCRPMGSSGLSEYLFLLNFMNSAPLNALVCTRSRVRKSRLAYSGE